MYEMSYKLVLDFQKKIRFLFWSFADLEPNPPTRIDYEAKTSTKHAQTSPLE